MKQGRRRFSRWLIVFCGVTLAGLLISWLLALGLGIYLPLDAFRKPIETAASGALGREVHVEGELVLRPSMNPTIVAHDVRVVSPNGEGDLLRAGRVAVRLAPLALLRDEPGSRRLLIEDVSIELDTRGVDAPSAGPAQPGEVNAGVYSRLLSVSAELLAGQPDLQELVLHRVVLNCPDETAGQGHQVILDEVSVHTRPGQPLELTLRGWFQQQPYTIELTGGQLAELLTPSGPWPLRVELSFADTRLLLNGELEAPRHGLDMTFELRVDWPAEFARLAARVGQAPLAGRLSLRTEQNRPLVAGELQLPALDAVLRFGAGAGSAQDTVDQPSSGGETPADGAVSVPLTVSIAGVPFHGQLSVAGQAAEPVVELAFSATDVHAGGLLATLTGTTGIRGRFQHIGLQARVTGRGETGMVNRVALALQVDGARLSYGNAAGERSVDVTLDELALTLPAGEAVLMRARGALLDETFSVEFIAGGLEAWLAEESWPIRLSATGAGAVLDISGPLAAAHADGLSRLQVALYGKRLGDLAAWLGVSPCAAESYKLRGQLVFAEDIGRLQFLQVRTGRTRLNGELDWSGYDQIARLLAVLHFEQLDTADIETLIPLVSQDSDDGAARGIAIDLPVLPRPVEIVNADIDLTIAHILLKLVDITDVSLSAQIRAGRLQRSPFHAQLGNASLQGYLDPASAQTAVVFENEDSDSVAGGRMDKLFSNAVRWVGNTAVVPLRWIFSETFSAGDSADCQLPGVKANTPP